jgi:HSP20 family protein
MRYLSNGYNAYTIPTFFNAVEKMLEPWNEESAFSPRSEWVEKEESLELNIEIPGVSPEDVKISLKGDILHIEGEKKSKFEDSKTHRSERYYGKFVREFSLPSTLDKDQVEASFKDGVLHIQVKKLEDQKPRTIEVKRH